MYEVIISDKAERQLKKLDKDIRERILKSLERSRIRPGHFFERLVGEKSYKLRVGNYRVIADIYENELRILVIEIGHRKNIYK